MSSDREVAAKPNTTYYLTTAINYTNGPPHIGHCFEGILTDFLARLRRLTGQRVFFLTGTDEHGLKIAKTADEKGIKPIEICDYYAKIFEDLAHELALSHDFFIRTTMPIHAKTVIEIFYRTKRQGDIYLGEYEGWYNLREETYVSDTEAQQSNFIDIGSGKPLQKVKEPSYFFRLSKYAEPIKRYIHEHPDFIVPNSARQQILSRLETGELRDLSISRTTFDWGIPVPDDPEHCLYVWMDALINYYTGPIAYEKENRNREEVARDEDTATWPPNLHVIGKDILWFHAVIWPAILLSADLPLPRQILAHNFIVDEEGKKMSKSLGNTVDVDELLKKFPSSILRHYLLSEFSLDRDLHFSTKKLITVNNVNADKLGNLVQRTITLCGKYCDSKVPEESSRPIFSLPELVEQIEGDLLPNFKINEYVSKFQYLVDSVNQYLVEYEPWKIGTPKDTKNQTEHDRQTIIRSTLEAIYLLSRLLEPIQPITSAEIISRLPVSPLSTVQPLSKLTWTSLIPLGEVTPNKILFPKL